MSGIYEKEDEIRQRYIQTDLSDIASIQTSLQDISENAYTISKHKYIEALNSATPKNIKKAKSYEKLNSLGSFKSGIAKNIGWVFASIIFLIILIAYPEWDTEAPDWMYLMVWIGIIAQIYIYVLKSAWSKLTLSGAVVHPCIKAEDQKDETPKFFKTNNICESSENGEHICSQCQTPNKPTAQFCENCGSKLE